jgi:hypothetical protein
MPSAHWSQRVVTLASGGADIVAGTGWATRLGGDLSADEPEISQAAEYRYVAGANREVTRPKPMDVRVVDNDAVGVLVVPTNGGTQVVEPTEEVLLGSGFLTQAGSARFDLNSLTSFGSWRLRLVTESGPVEFIASGGSAAALASAFASTSAAPPLTINNQPGGSFSADNPAPGVLRIFPRNPLLAVPFAATLSPATSPVGNEQQVRIIGDFGTAVVRETGIHDAVFTAQDLDAAKWNSNSNLDITDATSIPHLTVLGTGDGTPDFYSFEITEEMIANAATSGVRAIFDIDRGFELRDGIFWVSWLRLYELVPPIDPDQPTLPTLIAQGTGVNFRFDSGTSWFFDDYLEFRFLEQGRYYLEVTALWPAGDGLPEGVDYQLHVSIEDHVQDAFIFAVQPVAEQEPGNNTGPGDNTGQNLEEGTAGGDNFFNFHDPEVGNTDYGGSIGSGVPYVRVQGSGQRHDRRLRVRHHRRHARLAGAEPGCRLR